jgi:hypothetical protein
LIDFGWLVLEKKIFKNFQCILTLSLLPWRRAIPFIRRNLNTTTPQDDLCQVWIKLAQWFFRSRKCKSLQTGGQNIRSREMMVKEE